MTHDLSPHEETLAALVDARRLGASPDSAATQHLASCLECRQEWESLASTITRLDATRVVLPLGAEPSESLRERTRQTIAADRRADPTPRAAIGRWDFGWAGVGAIAGAAAMAVVLAMLPMRSAAIETFELVGGIGADDLAATVEIRQADADAVGMRLVAENLPANQAGEIYELWWVGPDRRHLACGTFRSDGTPIDVTFTSAANMDDTVLLEITIERDDGDTAPGPHIAQSRPADADSNWTPAP